MRMNRLGNMSLDCTDVQNCGAMSSGGTLTSTSSGASAIGCTPGNWINGCWYPYDYSPPYPYWWPNPQPYINVFGAASEIDYDLLADKIADRMKGTKERSKEEIRKEINKLLGELEKAK
jgi:hypothetical protein